MKDAGEENTEAFKELQAQFEGFVSKAAELERARKYSDELKDSLSSMSRGLDLSVQAFESMVGIMQVGSGIASAFGASEEEAAEQMNKMVQLMGVLQGVQTLYNQAVQQGTFLNKANAAADKAIAAILPSVTTGTKAATVATKGFSLALKSIGIGLVLEAVSLLIGHWDKLKASVLEACPPLKNIGKIFEEITPIIAGVGNVILNLVTGPITTLINTLSKLFKGDFSGAASEIKSGLERTYNMAANFEKGYNSLKDENRRTQLQKDKEAEAKKLKYQIDTLEAKKGADAKYSEERQKLYAEYFAAKLLMYDKDSEEYKQVLLEMLGYDREVTENDKKVAADKLSTAEDYAKKLQEVNDKIQEDELATLKDGFFRKIQELRRQKLREVREAQEKGIKVKEATAAIERKYDALELAEVKSHTEKMADMYRNAIEEISKYRNEQVKKNYEVSSNFFDQTFDKIINRYEAAQTQMSKFFEDIGLSSEKKEKTDSFEYVYKNQTKYVEKTLDKLKDFRKEYDVLYSHILQTNDEISNEIGKLLEPSKIAKPNFFKDSVAETIGEVNKLYGDAQGDITRSFDEALERLNIFYDDAIDQSFNKLDELKEKYSKAMSQIFKLDEPERPRYSEDFSKDEWNIYKKELEGYEEAKKAREETIDFLRSIGKEFPKTQEEAQSLFTELNRETSDFTDAVQNLTGNIESQRFVLNEFKKTLEGSYKEPLAEINQEALALMPTFNLLYNQLKTEDEDYQQRLKDEATFLRGVKQELDDYKNEMNEALNAKFNVSSEKDVQNLSLSQQKKYRDEQVKNEEKYNDLLTEVTVAYNNKIEALFFEHQNKIDEINKKSLENRNKVVLQQNKVNVEYFKNYFDALEKLRNNYKNASSVGIEDQNIATVANFAQDILSVKEFKKEYENTFDAIQKKKDSLEKAFRSGIIDEKTFSQTISELDQLQNETKNALDGMAKTWQEKAKDIAEVVKAATSMISQAFSSIADMQANNALAQIEKEKDLLDKQNEILEEKLSKAEDIYSQHNDNVSTLQEELLTVRGDRQDFLLGKLDEEINQREKAWNVQKKIEAQQANNEKKKEALEKRQEQVERKRRKQQKVIDIQMAIANTALGVTSALALKPFTLALVMASLASALGLAQVATIAGTKTYGNGGKLSGPSHTQGGIQGTGAFSNINVEGGEMIVNKTTTSKNEPLLTFINSKKKKLDVNDFVEFYSSNGGDNIVRSTSNKFANGGILPTPAINPRKIASYMPKDNKKYYVSVEEIEDVSSHMNQVKAIAMGDN